MSSLDELATNSPTLHSQLAMPEDSDGDTASQRSISLSSPAVSARNSMQNANQNSHSNHAELLAQLRQKPEDEEDYSYGSRTNSSSTKRNTVDTDFSSDVDPDDASYASHKSPDEYNSPNTSFNSSAHQSKSASPTLSPPPTTYPPRRQSDGSIAESFASGSSRKARPESILLQPPPGNGKLVLGIALVDFNHLVGPRIEWSKGEIFEDEEVIRMIPFLALPDGAHLSAEDYSYFHIVPSGPNPTTVFGISCNQQVAASALLVKTPDVTRSTVQKAVVVLASKPVFGPIRDKLGVVTTALFLQRDFTSTQILDDFESGLEVSLRTQMTESGLFMGTNLRELVHTFRQRTLILVKALILQKRVMFYGHPVERLCTSQYSLISLLPGLLQTLDDSGSPPLCSRSRTLSRPSSLRTSDRKSVMAYTGLPLDIFGKDCFFQPYLPLQQLDMLGTESKGWLVGTTNDVVRTRKEVDLFVNIETGLFEFRDPRLERSTGLTAADRKWMDDIVKDVNETWVEGEEDMPVGKQAAGMAFKGSDDYLRVKFDEYISAALAAVRYRDFLTKGEGVLITEPSTTSTEDFNHLWMSEFKTTNAYEVWERTTDPMLFDIIEPRHPCNEKPSVVSDIGLRLQEGIQDLKLDQQLAPAREAVSRTFTAGSMSFFKAVEGVRDRWAKGSAPSTPITPSTAMPATPETARPANTQSSSSIEEPEIVSKADLDGAGSGLDSPGFARPSLWTKKKHTSVESTASSGSESGSNPAAAGTAQAASTPARLNSWGSGIGSFMSSRVGRFSLSKSPVGTPTTEKAPPASAPAPLPLSPPPVDLDHVQSSTTPLAPPPTKVLVEPPTPTAKHPPPPSSPPPASSIPFSEVPPVPAVPAPAPAASERTMSPIDSLLHTLDTSPKADTHAHHHDEEEEETHHVLGDDHASEDEEAAYAGMAV